MGAVLAAKWGFNAPSEQCKGVQKSEDLQVFPGLVNELRFVLDEGDGTLWLANASKLRCRLLPKANNEDGIYEPIETEILFFEEDDFEEELKQTESVLECLEVAS